jgi:ankyrin repeat protein
MCAASGHVECLKVLHALGADLTAIDSELSLPALEAARHGHVAALKLMYELGAWQDVQNVRGMTSAHYAAAGGHVDVLRFLHLLGADLGRVDGNGQTPAHLAAKSRKLLCLKELGKLGADFGPIDRDGKTALDIAAGYTKLHRSNVLDLDSLTMLFEYGAVMTIPVVSSLLCERDEGVLSSNLRATINALQHGVVYSKNPIMAALTVSASFRQRSLAAATIKEDLKTTAKQFAQIATKLIRTEAMDDEKV